ncbi:MAG: hypothetical protein IPL05_08955 [Betaproteobacteria bacterium]|nr:hypothetical protein [Betaproteobacteria bacterium]
MINLLIFLLSLLHNVTPAPFISNALNSWSNKSAKGVPRSGNIKPIAGVRGCTIAIDALDLHENATPNSLAQGLQKIIDKSSYS